MDHWYEICMYVCWLVFCRPLHPQVPFLNNAATDAARAFSSLNRIQIQWGGKFDFGFGLVCALTLEFA